MSLAGTCCEKKIKAASTANQCRLKANGALGFYGHVPGVRCSVRRRCKRDVAMRDSPMNSFAIIFGHCVWIPPSPKAALVALGLFFGIGINGEPDIAASEAIVASQYVAAGKTQIEAQKEIASLNACFGTYEVPTENRNHSKDADLTPLRNAQTPISK
jgi:hypothetical protein